MTKTKFFCLQPLSQLWLLFLSRDFWPGPKSSSHIHQGAEILQSFQRHSTTTRNDPKFVGPTSPYVASPMVYSCKNSNCSVCVCRSGIQQTDLYGSVKSVQISIQACNLSVTNCRMVYTLDFFNGTETQWNKSVFKINSGELMLTLDAKPLVSWKEVVRVETPKLISGVPYKEWIRGHIQIAACPSSDHCVASFLRP